MNNLYISSILIGLLSICWAVSWIERIYHLNGFYVHFHWMNVPLHIRIQFHSMLLIPESNQVIWMIHSLLMRSQAAEVIVIQSVIGLLASLVVDPQRNQHNWIHRKTVNLAVKCSSFYGIKNFLFSSSNLKLWTFFSHLGCGIANKQKRIVGGQETEVNQYPWMALLTYSNRFYCGASLINDRYVMTAAHCVSGFNKDRIGVTLLEHDRSKPGETELIKRKVSQYNQFCAYQT